MTSANVAAASRQTAAARLLVPGRPGRRQQLAQKVGDRHGGQTRLARRVAGAPYPAPMTLRISRTWWAWRSERGGSLR